LQLLDEVATNYSPDSVTILALNRMEPVHQAQRFLTTIPAVPNITFVQDNQDHFFAAVEGYAMPETIVYNPAGEIVLHKRGNLTRDEIVAAVDAALSSE
jgi:hypothetical protein